MSEESSDLEIFCVGLNHETAPVSIRERMSISESELSDKCSLITREEGFLESVIISTCNRIELYVVADKNHDGDLNRCFGSIFKSDDFLDLDYYTHRGIEVLKHLCRVGCGLDSMVLGETEIFGQLKKAYSIAQSSGNTSKRLNKLFQNSFMISKHVRTNTKITRGATSVGAAGVDLAEKIFGDLKKCKVMVMGAGQMGQMVAKTLISRGVESLEVASRSLENASKLAEELGGVAFQLDDSISRLAGIDILITATSSPQSLIQKKNVESIFSKRRGRPLFIIDIAVPRDVDEDVSKIPGVYLYDMDALQRITASARARREEQITICEELIFKLIKEHSSERKIENIENYTDDGSDPVTIAKKIIIGTRGSELALYQARRVASELRSSGYDGEIIEKIIQTSGDKHKDIKLSAFSKGDEPLIDKGVFTKELEESLLRKEIDIAVHISKIYHLI